MTETHLVPQIAMSVAGFAALVSPIWISILLVFFRGKSVRGRWLFLIAGPVIAYTIVWLFTLVVIVPATFVLVLTAPATKELFDQMPYWFPIAVWVTKHQYLLASLACGGLAGWLGFWLWPRWPNILVAISQSPDSNVPPKFEGRQVQ
jgi:hypothetical protein